jgi:hypothetical protein
VADLDEFVSKIAALPLGDHRCGLPAKVFPQGLIGRTVVMLQPSGEAVRVIDRPVFSGDCVVSDLVRHLEPFLLEIRDIGRAVRDLHPGR